MIDRKKLLSKEQALTPSATGFLIACVLSGLVTFIFDQHSTWQQWTVFVHLLSGIIVTFILLPYVVTHFRRTIGFRRPGVIFTGLLSVFIATSLVFSGWHIMVFGQLEKSRWLYDLHWLSASGFVALLGVHLLLHVLLLPENRKVNDQARFPSLTRLVITQTGKISGFAFLFIVGCSLIYSFTATEYSQQAVAKNYEYTYGKHPFRPSQTETFSGSFIDRRQIGDSERCLNCHSDIGRQWLSSIHKQAASDPSYVTNINLLEKKKGIHATRYCEGCHAPVALLSGELSPGGQHGSIPGTMANNEGVSCMACHGIDEVVHVKGVASFRFKPKEDYLFAHSEQFLFRKLHDLLVRVKPDQHIADMGRSVLQDPKLCATCHAQFMDKNMNGIGWIKMQDEYSAWLDSPYSHKNEENFADTHVQRCQDCHMPLEKSRDPSANQDGLIRAHHFPGANTFLPILNNDHEQFNATKSFLQANKVRVNIDKPHRKDAVQTLQALDESIRSLEETPYYYYLNEDARIRLVVSNTGVGHDFPGGTIDINEAWIEFRVMDAEGRTVFASGLVDEKGFVDPDAYFYRALPVDKQGKLVWKHDLFNMAGESFRRVIKAGESDIVGYDFKVPAWAKSPLTVTASLKYRKLNKRYSSWALKDKDFDLPIIDMAWDSLMIPVKVRKEVEIENVRNTQNLTLKDALINSSLN